MQNLFQDEQDCLIENFDITEPVDMKKGITTLGGN